MSGPERSILWPAFSKFKAPLISSIAVSIRISFAKQDRWLIPEHSMFLGGRPRSFVSICCLFFAGVYFNGCELTHVRA
jgi:hypothetical protein